MLCAAGPDSPAAASTSAPERWQRWHQLSRAEQTAIVAQYEALVRRADDQDALSAASAFAALPPARQERLRELSALVERAIREQPPMDRRWLESLPGDAQAVEVMRLLRSDYAVELERFLPANGH
jgi:hypothetical protein